MAYRHYHTLGLVIGHTARGEASRLYQILTPDLGLVKVVAQSIRLEKSKLRYNLQNYNFVNLGLVRGREYWRLIGAERSSPANSLQVVFFRKISSILLRLIHGEQGNSLIFSDLEQAWELLIDKSPDSNLEDLEIFILIRLLANLGYIAPSDITTPIVSVEDFFWSDLVLVARKKGSLIRVINSSLLSSGL